MGETKFREQYAEDKKERYNAFLFVRVTATTFSAARILHILTTHSSVYLDLLEKLFYGAKTRKIWQEHNQSGNV